MEKEFKIGDTVKIIGNNSHSHTPIGTIGQIHSFQFSNSKRIRITVNGEFVTTVAPWINFGDYEHYTEEVVTDIIIEEEFKLPENWYVIVDKENQDVLTKWRETIGDYKVPIGNLVGICTDNGKLEKGRNPGHIVKSTRGGSYDFGIRITFEQFKQYVLKEKPEVKTLPFFEILKTSKMGTIIQVQNNEGNIFALGDNVRSITGNIKDPETMKILSFRYNNAKDNICAVTERLSEYGIGIDKIEHVIEFSKNEIIVDTTEPIIPKNESLLDKAKRLYPIGTHYINASKGFGKNFTYSVKDTNFKQKGSNIWGAPGQGFLYSNGQWAEIISKPEIKEEPVIITSSLKDMLELQNQGVKNVISIQPEKEETLLEKAKRLYPIGTYFETLGLYDKQKRECVVECEIFQGLAYGNYITRSSKLGCAQAVISKNGSKMAKILYNGYKIGDIIQVFLAIRKDGYYSCILEKVAITKLKTINGEEVAFFGEDNPHNRILIKNIKK